MKKYLLFTLLLAIGVVTDSVAQKFGYVDTQEIIELIPEVKEANAEIETLKTQLQKRGQEMLQALQVKYQGLERREAQGEISPKQLETEAAKLKQEEGTIVQFEQESQQKILQKSESLLAPIRDRIQKAIDDVAAENGFAYIFDYSTGFVLYADNATNVGSLVKAKLGL